MGAHPWGEGEPQRARTLQHLQQEGGQSTWAQKQAGHRFGGGRMKFKKKKGGGASQVAQWLRICLLMQGTRVRALVWEDPTCRGATRPVSHNY